jgi:hypothetical protein
VLRKGALVRVAGSEGDVDAEAAAFAFLDRALFRGTAPWALSSRKAPELPWRMADVSAAVR